MRLAISDRLGNWSCILCGTEGKSSLEDVGTEVLLHLREHDRILVNLQRLKHSTLYHGQGLSLEEKTYQRNQRV